MVGKLGRGGLVLGGVVIGLLVLAPLLEIGGAAAAQQIASDWLVEAASGAGDRGWTRLDGETRTLVFADDLDQYIEIADDSDWSSFQWSILYSLRDEPFNYDVAIAFEGTLPPLVAAVTYFEDSVSETPPIFAVRLRPHPFLIFAGEGIHQTAPMEPVGASR
jgi:hypothetical protein